MRYLLNTILMYLSYSLIAFVNLKCQNGNKYVPLLTIYRNSTLRLDSTSVIIETKSKDVPEYKIFSASKNGLFCGYDSHNNSIDIYSLKAKTFLKKIKLQNVNGRINDLVTGIYIISKDSVFILTRKNIVLYNSLGIIKKNTPINYNSNYFRFNYLLDFIEGLSLTYNAVSHTFYIPTINQTNSSNSLDHFNSSFITEYNTKTDIFSSIPIYYSALYKYNHYGFMDHAQYSLTNQNQSIVYNFPIDPNIYLFNIESTRITSYGGIPKPKIDFSSFTNPLSTAYVTNDDQKILHVMQNVRYYKILNDCHELYYRPYEEPIEYILNKKTGRYPSFSNKKRFLSVFSKNFEILKNIDLNDKMYLLGRMFVTDDGVYIPIAKKNILSFKVFQPSRL